MQRPMTHQDLERPPSSGWSLNEFISRPSTVKTLLALGIASTALYIALDAVAASRYDGYSYRDQVISELSAVGASTRGLWMVFGTVYAVMLVAFGAGVWKAAGSNRALRITGIALFIHAIIGLVLWPISPMHSREVLAAGDGTWTDTMHQVLGAESGLATLVILGFGAGAFAGRFRWFTLAMAAVVLVFGTLMTLQVPAVSDNESTPWIGIYERIMVFGWMTWDSVLGVMTWRGFGRGSRERRTAG